MNLDAGRWPRPLWPAAAKTASGLITCTSNSKTSINNWPGEDEPLEPLNFDQLQGRRVFVTGATGFIGRRLVSALRDAEADVTALLRTSHGARSLRDQSVEVIIASLDNHEKLSAALSETEIVFHLAYDIRASGQSNFDTFETLVRAAENTQVERFIHVSSIVVYDDWPHADIEETAPSTPPGDGSYRHAKIAMEQRLLKGDLPAAILQPTLVYGPSSTLWTDQLADKLWQGPVILPEPEGLCNGVFVDDLVQALMRAATVEQLEQERFIISGPEPFAWSDLLVGYAQSIGRGEVQFVPHQDIAARFGPEPCQASKPQSPPLAARISALGRHLLGRERFETLVRTIRNKVKSQSGPSWPDRNALALYSATGECHIDAARSRLGYQPEYTLDKGLTATAGYLRRRFYPKDRNKS